MEPRPRAGVSVSWRRLLVCARVRVSETRRSRRQVSLRFQSAERGAVTPGPLYVKAPCADLDKDYTVTVFRA